MAQNLLHFPIYWPETTLDNYLLDGIYLYNQPDESWADGPILELHYDYTSTGTSHSTGEIAIREFKPKAKTNVLQVVKTDAVHAINVDTKGLAQAIYVNGQWISLNKFSHRWAYGGRGELIYEMNGVVFWIVGDQRDGITQDVLWTIAQSLQAIDVSHEMHMGVEMTSVTQAVNDTSTMFAGDIVAVFPADNMSGPFLTLVGPDQPLPQEKPVDKHGAPSP